MVPVSSAIPLRKVIATVALSGALLETAATVGFDGVEIMEAGLLTFDGSPANLRHIAERLGFIKIYQPFRNFGAIPEPARTHD